MQCTGWAATSKRVQGSMDNAAMSFRLLDILRVLVTERHVSRAADRLGVSQPELSRTLAKLRQITGDQLLVRTATGMVPTARANQLASCAGDFLKQWNELTGHESEFKASECNRVFRVQAMDALVPLIVTPAIMLMRAQAPLASVSVSMPSMLTMRSDLDDGEIDLAIGILPQLPQDLFVSRLTDCPWVCVVAANHPRIDSGMSLDAYVSEGHVVPTFGRAQQLSLTERHVQHVLAGHDLVRHVVAYVPSVLTILEMVACTDLVAIVPEPVALAAVRRLPIRIVPLPLETPPHDLVLTWHSRTHNDPAHRWFRQLLRDAPTATATATATATEAVADDATDVDHD
jgi:DNA-binding transcriptional LysR family regulator